MINEICLKFGLEFLCPIIQRLPVVLLYGFLFFFFLKGFIDFLANFIPQIETLKSKVYLPLAKKKAFKKLSKQAIKSDIKGGVNTAILKFASEFPMGWLKPMEIEWVSNQSSEDFLDDNEIVIRIRPVENQNINFVTAVYYFLRKSFFPKTKRIIPESHLEASVLFTSRKIIQSEKPELKNLFEDYILEPEVDKNVKILNILEKYENIDKQGFFTSTFLREIHAVASEVKWTSMRSEMPREISEILKHIEDFMDHYNNGVKQDKWTDSIPAELWTRLGPVTNYGFLLIAMPYKVTSGVNAYVNRAKNNIQNGIVRLYVFGAESERSFADKVIKAIEFQVPEYKLTERFKLSHDYRGGVGGIGALFVKR
jgi:hypothetical protein